MCISMKQRILCISWLYSSLISKSAYSLLQPDPKGKAADALQTILKVD